MARLVSVVRWVLPAFIVVLLALVAPPSASADIRLDVVSGFDNNYRVGSWTPLQIRVSGISADTNARLQVIVRTQVGTQSYSRGVRLRAGAVNGPFPIYYFHPDLTQSKDVSIVLTADGRTLVEKGLDQVGNSVPIPEGQPAIIGLTQDQSGLNFLAQINLNYVHYSGPRDQFQNYNGFSNGTSRPNYNRIIYPKAPNLPDSPNGYEALDVAVLGDLPLDLLNEDQWDALVGWVRSGGILVVSGSADLNRLRSKQLAEVLPVEPRAVKQVSDLPGLGYRYQTSPKLRTSAVVVSQAKPDSQTLCRQADLPLVVERRLGNGLVVFTAFDLLAPEFRAWEGQAGLWSEIMQRGSGSTRIVEGVRLATEPSYTSNRWGMYGQSSNRTLSDALAGVQSTEAPSFRTIGIFLLCYILVLVPGNYLLLKRFDRKELAWVTIPVIIFLFSAGAYAVGYRIKGGQLYLHYCSVLEGAANADGWQAYTIGSIFSPRQARYDISVTDPTATVMEVTEGGGPSQRALGDLVVDRDQKTVVKSALVNMWDHRQFGFRTNLDVGGQVSAAVLPAGDGTARVMVSNGLTLPLTDCSISYGTTQTFVGNLAPGESKTVKVSVSAGGNPGAISVIGAGQSTAKAVKDIREALAGVVSTASNYSQYQNPMNNGVTQPVNATRRTPLVLTGWCDRPLTGLSLEGEAPVTSGATLLVVHLPDGDTSGTAAPPPARPPAAREDPFSKQGMPNVRRIRVRGRAGVISPSQSRPVPR